MKSSTILALLMATVTGLVGVSSYRLWNHFRSPAVLKEEPQIKVLVANQNILKGNLIDPRQVMVRSLRPDEKGEYLQSTDHYLPAIESAVYLRIAGENIMADTPIRTEYLEPFENPEGVPERLAPQMRPVNLSVEIDDSSGGLLRVGDWVNVYFSSLVTGEGLKDAPRRVLIVPNARIILKRNTLRPIYSSLPGDKPVPFTIETNGYRAALCDFAKDLGEFSLVAIPESEAKKLESARNHVLEDARKEGASVEDETLVSFNDPESDLYKTELDLVKRYVSNGEPISDHSLQELFRLVPRRVEPAEPKRFTRIQQYHGTKRVDDVVISPERRVVSTSLRGSRRPNGERVEEGNLNTPQSNDAAEMTADSYESSYSFRKPITPSSVTPNGQKPKPPMTTLQTQR